MLNHIFSVANVKAPDTRFIKEDRTTLLKCQACGATRPVKL